jgi:glycosyltransferase involved in cell wall biosynthesis
MGTMRACTLHDHIVARRLKKLAGHIDIVHTWPIAAEQTLKVAAQMGIPTVLERPNAHTRFAFETYARECERLGVKVPRGHEYAYKADVLEKEEREYALAYRILCASDFSMRTFIDQGIPPKKLVRHIYGFDEKRFYPGTQPKAQARGFTAISVGVQAVKKGLHYALDAWLKSPAHEDGRFLIAGETLPAYAEKIMPMLSHPSVHLLGHRSDVPELMRKSDIMVLPSIEEGFGLVCVEAMGSGCVPLVSEACTDVCKHMENALVHPIGDVDALSKHITVLYNDRLLLARLRDGALRAVSELTWTKAGVRLLEAYREVIRSRSPEY